MELPVSVPLTFRIIAHRGASAYAPENTWAAFALAYAMHCYEVELDTQLSADGQVVLCHDTTLHRYGHGGQIVEQLRWPALAALDMGSWFSPFLFAREPMLRLSDLFARDPGNVTYHIELKGSANQLPHAVCAIIARRHLQQRCIVTSFSDAALRTMQQLAPHLRRAWLVDRINHQTMRRAEELALFQLCPRADTLTAALVSEAHGVVPEVRAWGVAGTSVAVAARLRQLVDAGCAGATLNGPDWAEHAVA